MTVEWRGEVMVSANVLPGKWCVIYAMGAVINAAL